MDLKEFDLIYTYQKEIKVQVIVDVLTVASYAKNSNKNELMILVEQCDEKTWTLFFDGSKCLQGARVEIMLVSLEGGMILMVYKLNFDCTNNIVEYEALILGLKETINLGITHLKVYGDS